jgi:DNA-binding response OmpR family regulator
MSKLLIVDDEADVREFAKSFFSKRAIKVITAAGGKDALALVEKEKPDLILLDVRMDEMTGVEVLEQLRARGDQSRVIMVTGVEEDDVIARAKELGALNYIHKPLVLDELENVVLRELNAKK